MTESIYWRPDDYDLEHEGDDRDASFYAQLLERLGARRVLEWACGSGRLTLPLASGLAARHGSIVGVELETKMLDLARRKLEAADALVRAHVRLEPGDMRSWRVADRFDAVLIGCSSITHLLTLDEQLAVWRSAFDHLVAGGRFIIDVTMPDFAAYADAQRSPPRALTHVDLDQSDPETGARLIRQRATHFDVIAQRADIQFFYDRFERGEHVARYVSDFAAHVYFPRELELLFRHTGFAVEAMWADYHFRAPNSATREIVWIGRKPE